jgi:hypothetical protein
MFAVVLILFTILFFWFLFGILLADDEEKK